MNKFFEYKIEEIPTMRECTNCKEIKPITEYHKHPSSKWVRRECKVCVNQKNRIKLQGIYNDPDKLRKHRENQRNYFLRNKDKGEFKINHGVRKLIIQGFKRNDKDRKIIRKQEKTERILGCSVPYFVEWIKKQLVDGMSMDNYGKVWILGHIVPNGYGLENEDKINLLNHYKNYAPQFKIENGELNCKIWKEKFTEYHAQKYKTIIEEYKEYQRIKQLV